MCTCPQFTADSGYSELFSFKRGGSAELIYTVKKLTLGEPFPEVLTTHTQTLPTQDHGIQLKVRSVLIELMQRLFGKFSDPSTPPLTDTSLRVSPVKSGVTLCLGWRWSKTVLLTRLV